MVVIRGRLTPELGAVVQRAIEAAAERLYQEARVRGGPTSLADEMTPAQRRADALGLLAESALTTDLDRGSAGDRYQVVLHVEASRSRRRSLSGTVEVDDGAVDVSAETSRRISCDASVVAMRHDAGRRRARTSGARPARFRPRSGGRSRRATEAADSLAAPLAAATPITSSTGPMAAQRVSITWCCCAAAIIGPSTKADST